LKVGIFDADMYGPSLPTLIKVNNPNIYQDEKDPKMIAPINFSGMKCMSYGFANSGKTAIMRGPMVSNLVT
jgi:ATP-binding protein involved in chromosome partitioning